MTPRFKSFGLIIVAAFAAAAMLASAAQGEATSAGFTAEDGTYPEGFSASSPAGSLVWGTEAGLAECALALSGSMSAKSQKLSLKPVYSKCNSFGFLEATVHHEGCGEDWNITTKTGADTYQAHMDIICPTGQSIKFTSGTCRWEVKSQTGLTTVNLENMTASSPHDLTVKYAVTGIAYTVTADPFGCPFNGTGNKTGATLTTSASSAATLSASGGVHVG